MMSSHLENMPLLGDHQPVSIWLDMNQKIYEAWQSSIYWWLLRYVFKKKWKHFWWLIGGFIEQPCFQVDPHLVNFMSEWHSLPQFQCFIGYPPPLESYQPNGSKSWQQWTHKFKVICIHLQHSTSVVEFIILAHTQFFVFSPKMGYSKFWSFPIKIAISCASRIFGHTMTNLSIIVLLRCSPYSILCSILIMFILLSNTSNYDKTLIMIYLICGHNHSYFV